MCQSVRGAAEQVARKPFEKDSQRDLFFDAKIPVDRRRRLLDDLAGADVGRRQCKASSPNRKSCLVMWPPTRPRSALGIPDLPCDAA